MLSGLPASGKSTRARELYKEYGNAVIVSRDNLRDMLHGGATWSGVREKSTMHMQMSIVRAAMARGNVAIIDDTNMGEYHKDRWRGVANETNSEFEVVAMDTDIKTCLGRDIARGNKVGRHTILEMAMQYGLYKTDKSMVICDIDGTVANCEHRKHYLDNPVGDKKNWKGFFSEMDKDTPITDTIDTVRGMHKLGHEIVFVSARPEDYRSVTEAWLEEHIDFPYTTLIMRHSGDSRQDAVVKEQILHKYFTGKYNVAFVLDDRPSVIRMWRENGLEVIDVGDGIEF